MGFLSSLFQPQNEEFTSHFTLYSHTFESIHGRRHKSLKEFKTWASSFSKDVKKFIAQRAEKEAISIRGEENK